jgi:hypothetical protein
MLRIIAERGDLFPEVDCPHDDTDWSAAEWADRPPCRRHEGEDGQPYEGASGCAVRNDVEDYGAEAFAPPEPVTLAAGPIRSWAWVDGCVYIDPTPDGAA